MSLRNKIRFVRENAKAMALWPVACGSLISAIWGWAWETMHHENIHLRELAQQTVVANARMQAQKVERTIGNLDYIMQSLQSLSGAGQALIRH